jgi:hypothetical protein
MRLRGHALDANFPNNAFTVVNYRYMFLQFTLFSAL